MSAKKPNVIIFLKAYNAEKTLQRAIDSILNQTYKDFRLYLFNNASTDETMKIMKTAYTSDPRVYVLYSKVNNIRNDVAIIDAIWLETPAKWFTVIDADDEFEPTFLSEMVKFGEKHHLNNVLCGYKKIDENTGEILKEKKTDRNLLIKSPNDFANYFTEFRGLLSYTWAKLRYIPFIKELYYKKLHRHHCDDDMNFEFGLADDTNSVQRGLFSSKSFGVIGKSLYKYYHHDNMYSKQMTQNIDTTYRSLTDLYFTQKKFLISIGDISKKNQEFLYAILLSVADEFLEAIYFHKNSSKEAQEKITELFEIPEMQIILNTDFTESEMDSLKNKNRFFDNHKNKLSDIFGADNIENWFSQKK
jgi:glycosyltransferase involved in cell wall biosynthesis